TRPRGPTALMWGDPRRALLREPARRRGAARLPLQRIDPAAWRGWPRAGRLGAVVLHHDMAHAGRDLAGDDAAALPRPQLGCPRRGHGRAAHGVPPRARAALVRRM